MIESGTRIAYIQCADAAGVASDDINTTTEGEMMISLKKVAAAVALIAAGAAQAGSITLTVDNNYSVWTGSATTLSSVAVVARDTTTVAPIVDTDWTTAESYSFVENGWLYVVTDSDDVNSQGFLSVTNLVRGKIETGDANTWQVARWTPQPATTTAVTMTAGQLGTFLATAVWEQPYVIGANVITTGPWGPIVGGSINTIGSTADWVWASAVGGGSPANANVGEPLVWRLAAPAPVPEPAGIALVGLALAGVAATTRRRKA